jgi:predicted TIM-barrel fold metal-dependent hydrolase
MTTATKPIGHTYRGNHPRTTAELLDWHEQVQAAQVLDPELVIVDAHHHLFGDCDTPVRYELDDLCRDLNTGHRVSATVYVEAYGSGWRTLGPQAYRPIGEIEKIIDLTVLPLGLRTGACQVAAGIVSSVDLRLNDGLDALLEAHVHAAQGRLRGVRQHTAWVEGAVGSLITEPPPPMLMQDAAYRYGVRQLARFGLSVDVTAYHTQLDDLASLADACADTRIIVNHIATPIGVAEFAGRRQPVFDAWRAGMRRLAQRPNVAVKIGGMGMAVFGFGFENGPTPAHAAQLARAWQPYIDECIAAFGTKRCLLESNFPVDKNSASYIEVWNAFKLATQSLSTDEKADLFHRSACEIYRLPAVAA